MNAVQHPYDKNISAKCSDCQAAEDYTHYLTCAQSGIENAINESDTKKILKKQEYADQLVKNIINSKRHGTVSDFKNRYNYSLLILTVADVE